MDKILTIAKIFISTLTGKLVIGGIVSLIIISSAGTFFIIKNNNDNKKREDDKKSAQVSEEEKNKPTPTSTPTITETPIPTLTATPTATPTVAPTAIVTAKPTVVVTAKPTAVPVALNSFVSSYGYTISYRKTVALTISDFNLVDMCGIAVSGTAIKLGGATLNIYKIGQMNFCASGGIATTYTQIAKSVNNTSGKTVSWTDYSIQATGVYDYSAINLASLKAVVPGISNVYCASANQVEIDALLSEVFTYIK